jgi:hypothetical protein
MRTPFMLLAGAGLAALVPSVSEAACGSAFCTVNTDWNVQGVFLRRACAPNCATST